MVENFSLTDDQFGDLEDTMVNDFDEDDQAAVQAWLDENPDVVEEMSVHLDG